MSEAIGVQRHYRNRRGGLLLVFIAPVLSTALAAPVPNPVHWSSEAPQKPLHPGATFTIKLHAQIDPGWHLYGLEQDEGGPLPTEISLADDAPLSLGTIRAPKPVQLFDPNFNKRVSLYVDKADFSLPLTASPSASPGSQHAAIHIRYQCCNDTMCLSPKNVAVDLTFTLK